MVKKKGGNAPDENQPKDWESKLKKKMDALFMKSQKKYLKMSVEQLGKAQWNLIDKKLLARLELETLREVLAEKEGVKYVYTP